MVYVCCNIIIIFSCQWNFNMIGIDFQLIPYSTYNRPGLLFIICTPETERFGFQYQV